jgi:general L-amino acid transport system substrate-binding protein
LVTEFWILTRFLHANRYPLRSKTLAGGRDEEGLDRFWFVCRILVDRDPPVRWIRSSSARWCGVSAGFAGFSAPDSQGNYKGLDVDYCRALAAGVLGDATKVRYVALTAQNRFTALQSGEIDVLYRNSTQTYLRGVTLGLRQGPVNFYDGQGFLVKKDAGVTDLKGLNGATVCVAQGTTHEVTLGDYGRANGIEWKPLVFDRVDTMYQTFFGGRCDAMTQDASALAGAVATAAPNAADYVVLPTTISKEPLGPFTRNGDEVWSDIITWLHYGLVEAEELGVTAANADEVQNPRRPQSSACSPPATSARPASTTVGWCWRSRPAAITARF